MARHQGLPGDALLVMMSYQEDLGAGHTADDRRNVIGAQSSAT